MDVWLGVGVGVVFFQAEDGIRDKLVTGVQTCALPISLPSPQRGEGNQLPRTPLPHRGEGNKLLRNPLPHWREGNQLLRCKRHDLPIHVVCRPPSRKARRLHVRPRGERRQGRSGLDPLRRFPGESGVSEIARRRASAQTVERATGPRDRHLSGNSKCLPKS